MALSDSVGRVVEKYQYAVYGNPRILNQNNKQLTESKYGNPYMFTGRRFDTETRLYYYRARYYSTEIGRFLQVDPIGYEDSMNLYIYVGNNPILLVDPSGLCQESSMWWDGIMEMATVFSMWVRGEGPDNLVLGRGHAFTELMMSHRKVQEAREGYIAQNAGRPREEYTTYELDEWRFGLIDAIRDFWHPAHFLATYDATVSPNSYGTDTVTITNKTSWASYWGILRYAGSKEWAPRYTPGHYVDVSISPYYGVARAIGSLEWERSVLPYCGNMRQTITWTEQILP